MKTWRLALVQNNPCVGDLSGNLAQLYALRKECARAAADIMITGEHSVTGYPLDDLANCPDFIAATRTAVQAWAAAQSDGDPAVICGAPWCDLTDDQEIGADNHKSGAAAQENSADDHKSGAAARPFNAALVIDAGRIVTLRSKRQLPSHGVFTDERVYRAGDLAGPVVVRGLRLGIMICEDLWTPEVSECLGESGAELLVALNASPFSLGQEERRQQIAIMRVRETGLPLLYVNLVGGQDDLVFDGCSFALDAGLTLTHRMDFCRPALDIVKITRHADGVALAPSPNRVAPLPQTAAVYAALICALHDYVEKNGFSSVLLGLSGGIDSALTATLACDALGAERVQAVFLPSGFTSKESQEDAQTLAHNLGISLETLGIDPARKLFERELAPLLPPAAEVPAVTFENLQARIRGLLLMALSNARGTLLLATGNKSELACGYSTLYGDLCGGFAPLKDLTKAWVGRLARWRSGAGDDEMAPIGAKLGGAAQPIIPERICTKEPSAELAPGQKDSDHLPPYDRLDAIVDALITANDPHAAAAAAENPQQWQHLQQMIQRAEYKRAQAPLGPRISRRAFGRGRRYPITNAFSGR